MKNRNFYYNHTYMFKNVNLRFIRKTTQFNVELILNNHLFVLNNNNFLK